MNLKEFDECLSEIQKYYESFSLTQVWLNRWYKDLRNFEKKELLQAIDDYTGKFSKYPTLPDIKELTRQAAIRIRREDKTDEEIEKILEGSEPVIRYRQSSKIEFAMNALGVEVVTEELKIIGKPETVRWYDLVKRKDWIPEYNKVKENLFLTAKEFQKHKYSQSNTGEHDYGR